MAMKKLLEKGMGEVMEIFSISLMDNFKLIFHHIYQTGETVLDVIECGETPRFYQISEAPADIRREIEKITKWF